MADQIDTPAQSGRELARARRRAMSRTGAANIKAGSSASRAPGKVAVSRESDLSAARQAAAPAAAETSGKPLTGRAFSIYRRAMLAKGGKSALRAAVPAQAPAATTGSNADARQPEACCDACAKGKPCTGGRVEGVTESAASSETLDSLCEIVESTPQETGSVPSTVRDFCRQRRSILSTKGKQGTPAGARRPTRPTRQRRRSTQQRDVAPERSVDNEASRTVIEDPSTAKVVDGVCEIIESNPREAARASSSVRDFCRQRRSMLSRKGKLGLSGRAGSQARKSVLQSAAASSLTGKALARLHREARCQFGRGDAPSCRPTGRVRPGSRTAPAKVEMGTTLSGQTVTGTQVEQTEKVTGAESGVCRSVTGTEYLGAEQFEKFCPGTPSPAAAKVAVSETSHGQQVTGTNPAGSSKVTGDEAGHCKSVTGSEYLGVEYFDSFCGSRGINATPEKVATGHSGKNLRITGVDEARDSLVTGSDYGAGLSITGTEYTSTISAKAAAEPPAKVLVSHTVAGTPVSGGDAPRKVTITGDDQDLCRRVTGTEYISSERFQTVCGTVPEGAVAKVGVDVSRGGMNITGNLVNRSEKVTGNEPGACQRVTGSQYGDAARDGLCSQRSDKVQEMHTSRGRLLTGTEATPSPKSTGDVQGRCADVTGTEYVSREQFEQSCPQVPSPGTSRADATSRTWNDQIVSGTQTGHSDKITGDERGLCRTVTGSSYEGREQVSEFCPAPAVREAEQRLRHQDGASATPVSGMTPAVDERMAGGFQRGVCQNLTGTPYQGAGERALCDAPSVERRPARGVHPIARPPADQALLRSAEAPDSMEAPSRKGGFSVVSPARAAWRQRESNPVHASVYARGSSITGVVNKAEGVISGTPEFRHLREMGVPAGSAPVAAQADEAVPRGRITGEGRETGAPITGDDWSRSGLVTGTEGMFSAKRNQTQQGRPVERRDVGAHALKDRERPEKKISRVTGSSGGTSSEAVVTLSGGASG